ncbi:putative ATP-dependent helicase DinG [Candidatus Methanoperedenaceae archaeon GB37]|nr:putative ATP-dependent helicase DinG [Candidatus Methanoperedenaceae archaeon GB37]
MAVKVSQAITEKKTVIIEAGTGTGKTLAYVIPAILSGKKVVISTGTKGLQDQLFYKDIPLIKKILRKDFKAVYLKGRRNYLCLWRFNQALKSNLLEETKEIKALKDWLKQTNIGDIAEAPLPPEWPGWQEFTSSTEQCLGTNMSLLG